MIRTKSGGNRERGRGGLPAQHPSEHRNAGENGGGGQKKEWYEMSPYYRNPPEHTKWTKENPGPGRPPYKVLTQELWKQLEKVDPKTEEPRYIALIESIIEKAIGKSPGSGYAAQLIFDRVEGLLKQKVEVAGLIGVVPIALGDLDGDLKKLSDAELALAERVGLLGLQRARQLEQQREREE